MKFIFDIGHPAHVHFFKNAIWALQKRSHEVLITARDKEVSLNLLNAYGFSYIYLGKNRKGLINKASGMLKIDYDLLNISRKFQPDLLIGVHNPYIAHVGRISGRPSITFTDTEHAKLASLITFPFTDVICTPSCFKKNMGPKQIRYDGYHELAYLHHNYFKPKASVLDELGLNEDEKIIIMRFVSWDASHDQGQKGMNIDMKRKLLYELIKYGKVLITSEVTLSSDFEEYRAKVAPEKLHDLLFYASLYVGEGATIATEAGLLGTPSIYVSSLVGSMGNFEELQNRYGLVYAYKDQKSVLEKAVELIKNPESKYEWGKKMEKLLRDKLDVTAYMVRFFEGYPESFKEYKKTT